MAERVETIIVGAGQAGLALSHCLSQLGCEHLLLERGRIAERWRSERWDSFALLSPNWHTRLPGFHYQGLDPDGFMGKQDIVRHFESYAASFQPPVRTGVEVNLVQPLPRGRWQVETKEHDQFEAANVVVAIGGFQRPHFPAVAESFPSDLFQIHTTEYRSAEQIPPGGVLI